ncbi:MAG: aminotransferase class III-fold pyridoxal phosphate-dependent enzyme [Alphaproteobacteria bacterium]|jgi:glutamate-1-semialdehyde 2,1-aminomutase|nr:aminotransferase class III-fold pyridoxal phosphate-dependent enzyme [Alphaproteobacteria bacterium]
MATEMIGDAPIANADLDVAVAAARDTYTARNPTSLARHEEACRYMPGGNTRTTLFHSPFPLAMERGAEARLWDVDGHEYVDFVGDFTAGLFGHSHPVIRQALNTAMDAGISMGSTHHFEVDLAKVVCARFPSMEQVRFCNSGTEANTFAILTACATTGRDEVMVFNGAYHGSTLQFRPDGKRDINLPIPFVMAPYNDVSETVRLIEEHASSLAAVLIEPLQGGGGCIAAETVFLQALRAACSKHNVVLIFDEVLTSRLGPGGLQGVHGITPDMTTIGKYIGGGSSFGGFGGRKDIMERFDSRHPNAFAHYGTFNNNVLTMAAGAAGMSAAYTVDEALRLNAAGDQLRDRINALAAKGGHNLQACGIGGVMTLHFQTGPIRSVNEIKTRAPALKELLQLFMMERGIFADRRCMLSLSLPMTEADLERLTDVLGEFLETHGGLLPGD